MDRWIRFRSFLKHLWDGRRREKEENELGEPKGASVQRDHGSVHARLVGALPLQYIDPYFAVVHLPQWISICHGLVRWPSEV
ncbi:hypothetical protein OPV22_010353 [Ensete ventricosum]|uniref:Uncharacterized protein n=1 Tax=Ensete ventricosum TaxID=4639 RepID=A0AAV8RB30_ENSVE|nr:hypothetical protein OPV22_010353 [Ensete ventricosum]